MRKLFISLLVVLLLMLPVPTAHAQVGNIFNIRGCDEIFNEIEDWVFDYPGSVTINGVWFVGYFYSYAVYEYGFIINVPGDTPNQQSYFYCIQ